MKGRHSVRGRIIAVFALAVFVVLFVSLLALSNAWWLRSRVVAQFRTELYIEDIEKSMSSVNLALDSYVSTGAEGDRRALEAELESLTSVYLRSPRASDQRTRLMLRSIRALLAAHKTRVGSVIQAKSLRLREGYLAVVQAAEQTERYVSGYADRILLENLTSRAVQYREFSRVFSSLQALNVVMIVGAVLFTLLLLAYLTRQFYEPLARLSAQATEIARGNLDQPDLMVESRDEIGVTADAFDRMKHSIREYVRRLREAAEVEKNLAEQRVRNLRMHSLLRSAEMESLRSQMDPHFLFNTLNTGVQLAIVEDAERTAAYMETTAELFRYNVKRDWQSNTVSDETRGIELYRSIIDVRFPGRYDIEIAVPTEVMELRIPPLVLQPLVENSILHGFDGADQGGRIEIAGGIDGGFGELTVRDNGRGIEAETIERVLEVADADSEFMTPRSRIGLRNVVLRLRLFYEDERAVRIWNAPQGGAVVSIRIRL